MSHSVAKVGISPLLLRKPAVLFGDFDGPQPRMHPKFTVDMLDVLADGLDADKQQLADLLKRLIGDELLQNFDLARGQRIIAQVADGL